MSLTKQDFQQIEQAISRGITTAFEQYIIPYVDARIDGLERKLTGRMTHLEQSLNQQFFTLHEKIEENTVLIGHYFESCASNEQFQDHEIRIRKLELAK